ncbi:DUF2442 domain-containing protein [Aliamphritea hakodatensis]|uniref:DUF2442 domain-containing protein n=1 Tax=Aliamphritea hakodatensis TaxID=2895352 RepID=UPI0022FD6EDB|nr:DUF2442 domain-containing protein [Aliamphritea hakodatensis]
MTIVPIDSEPRAVSALCSEGSLTVQLRDGRTISVPLEWFPRLNNAQPDQLKNLQLLGDGEGIHWPALDEDLSIAGLLSGNH